MRLAVRAHHAFNMQYLFHRFHSFLCFFHGQVARGMLTGLHGRGGRIDDPAFAALEEAQAQGVGDHADGT